MQMDASWEEWKKTLAQAVGLGQNMGMSPEQMVQKAEQVGDYLAKKVDPNNPQQKLLQDLWSVANQNEQKALAAMLIKMVNQGSLQ